MTLRSTLDFLLYDWLVPRPSRPATRFATIRVKPSMRCSTPASASPARNTPPSTAR